MKSKIALIILLVIVLVGTGVLTVLADSVTPQDINAIIDEEETHGDGHMILNEPADYTQVDYRGSATLLVLDLKPVPFSSAYVWELLLTEHGLTARYLVAGQTHLLVSYSCYLDRHHQAHCSLDLHST